MTPAELLNCCEEACNRGPVVEVEIRHEPRHWNPTCACFIPEAYTAFVFVDGEALPKWPCGSTYDEAKRNVLREFPTAQFS